MWFLMPVEFRVVPTTINDPGVETHFVAAAP
jgi:hypothetical protein